MKTIIFLFFSLLIALYACNEQNITQKNDLNKEYPIPKDSLAFYFPLNKFGRDSFVIASFSKHLFSLNEPIIYDTSVNKEVYRFTLLATWGQPRTIRLEKTDEGYIACLKITDGMGGYQAGKVIFNKEKIISEENWGLIKTNIDKIKFWDMPSTENIIGIDGSEWILEGNYNSKYNVVVWWSPTKGGYYDCCKSITNLFKAEIDSMEGKSKEFYK